MTSPHFHAIMNGLVTEAEFKRIIFLRQSNQNGYLGIGIGMFCIEELLALLHSINFQHVADFIQNMNC